MTRLEAAAATDPGHVRSSNQDIALVADGLVAVADGMGGHAGGEVAASTAVNVLEQAFATDRSTAGLVSAARSANGAIYAHSERQKELRGMGTTLTAAAIVRERGGERLAVVNVGDSRAYLTNPGGLVRLTEDHSLVEEMVRQGEMTQAEAAVHPHRHILTRALGIDPGVEVDSWALEPRPGSRLLLCSDGLTNECSDDEIAEILAAHAEPAAAAQALVARALQHGGSDNVTVVVADVVADGTASTPLDRSVVEQGPAGSPAAAGAAPRGLDPSASSPPPPDDLTAAVGAVGAASAGVGLAGGALAGVAGAAGPAASPPGPSRRRRQERSGRSPGHSAPAPAPATRRRRREDRVVTVWSVVFVLAFVGVLGGTAGFVEWFVRATYFVGFAGDRVAVFQGRPGGFLWFRPHVVEETSLTRAKVFSPYVPLVEKGMIETSFAAARKVAGNLGNANAFLALPTTATSAPVAAAVSPTSMPAVATTGAATSTSAPATTAAPAPATTTTSALTVPTRAPATTSTRPPATTVPSTTTTTPTTTTTTTTPVPVVGATGTSGTGPSGTGPSGTGPIGAGPSGTGPSGTSSAPAGGG